MSDIERWQQTNDIYLSEALHWLRLKLAQRIQPRELLPVTVRIDAKTT